MKTAIEQQLVANGSYGIYRINPRNGVRRGNIITVWHVIRDDRRIATYATRHEARDAVREITKEDHRK